MSSSDSIHALAMMESVALNEESRVIVDDLDYVLVSKNNDNDAMEVDDDSYDYCEDVVSMLSVEQPSSLSVCSDLPSIDPACFGIEKEEAKPQRRPRVISFGNDEDELCTRTGKFESTVEPLDEQMTETEESVESVDTPIVEPEPPVEENQTMSEADERIESIGETAMTEMKSATSRLSNKKRRKKMKLMKRAAAAAAAAAALSEMTAYMPTAPTLPPAGQKRNNQKAKATNRTKKSASVAVACATEIMEEYRREIANKKKGSSKLVAPL